MTQLTRAEIEGMDGPRFSSQAEANKAVRDYETENAKNMAEWNKYFMAEKPILSTPDNRFHRRYLGHGLWAAFDSANNNIRLYGAGDAHEFLWMTQESWENLQTFAEKTWLKP